MAEPTSVLIEDDEDKAQSTLGTQSAFMSMLNMGMSFWIKGILTAASKLGRDLPDITDEETDEETDDEHDDRSSGGIT